MFAVSYGDNNKNNLKLYYYSLVYRCFCQDLLYAFSTPTLTTLRPYSLSLDSSHLQFGNQPITRSPSTPPFLPHLHSPKFESN